MEGSLTLDNKQINELSTSASDTSENEYLSDFERMRDLIDRPDNANDSFIIEAI